MKRPVHLSTGITGLDAVVDSLRPGDNVVWQVDDIESYRRFVAPYVRHGLASGTSVVYLRFASHPPLVADAAVIIHALDATAGFESFTAQVHSVIAKEGRGAMYVFDCLSELLDAWASDLMIGNFFAVTCPYLFELDTLAYFALLRNSHSFKTIARIREITQLMLDVHSLNGQLYLHPLKVWQRYAPTMFLPHLCTADAFTPVLSSVSATVLFSRLASLNTETAQRQLDYWDRLFLSAAELVDHPPTSPAHAAMLDRLCRIMVARDERMLGLARCHLSLRDVLAIKERLIGTGYVGGKAVGMLLARAMLVHEDSAQWNAVLEPHDSFFIGSDVFYSFLVQNGWWKLHLQHKTQAGYLTAAASLRDQMASGSFPDEIRDRFQRLVDYFGQAPIIVRSSSLLEDSFGNAFAGKYESIFLVNQGSPDERYVQFENAVRRVYASTMSEEALAYRQQRGLADKDEQMALLVQRVSGAHHRSYFFPEFAGVGLSYNTFVWRSDMDPKAGMLRLVFGLGTRAVNRVDGDYSRIVALDDPLRQPVLDSNQPHACVQRNADVLNTASNTLESASLDALFREINDIDWDSFTVTDDHATRYLHDKGSRRTVRVLSFDRLMVGTSFCAVMQSMMKTLERLYSQPVDIEFTANHEPQGSLRINLLQCRPLQTRGIGARSRMPKRHAASRVLFTSSGNFMGGNAAQPVSRIIVVDADRYAALATTDKYAVARLIGLLNSLVESRERTPALLIGPGRWGTTTPSLGVPVKFAEINRMAVLVEIAGTKPGMMPELSFGTHFFQDLVESDTIYIALHPGRDAVVYNPAVLARQTNALASLLPDERRFASVVTVCDAPVPIACVYTDVVSQQVTCLFEQSAMQPFTTTRRKNK